MAILLKNESLSDIDIPDLGITVDAEGQYDLSLQSLDEIRASRDLLILLAQDDLKVDDGLRTLLREEAISVLYGEIKHIHAVPGIPIQDGVVENDVLWSGEYINSLISGVNQHSHNHSDINDDEPEKHFLQSEIDHVNLLNKGTNTHGQIDAHIANTTSNPHNVTAAQAGAVDLTTYNNHVNSSNIHFTEGDISHLNIQDIGTNNHTAIDSHISDTSIHYPQTDIDHTNLLNKGTNTHTQIDSHIADGTIHFEIDDNDPNSTSKVYSADKIEALLDTKQSTSEKGQANGYPPLGADGKVPSQYLDISGLTNKGVWDANTNTPTIPAAAPGNDGWFYIVNVAGTTNVDGETDWNIGDWILSDGTVWSKIDQSISKDDIGLGNVTNCAQLCKDQNLDDLPNKSTARTNLDVYDKATIDAHTGNTNNPHSVDHTDVGSSIAQWNANKIVGVEIDDTNKADGRELYYNQTSGKLEYRDPPASSNNQNDIQFVFGPYGGCNYDYIKIDNSCWKSVNKFIFRGTSVMGTPTKTKLLGKVGASNDDAWVQLYDYTNNKVISQIYLPGSPTSLSILEDNTLVNLPTGEAILGIRAKVDDANVDDIYLYSYYIQF